MAYFDFVVISLTSGFYYTSFILVVPYFTIELPLSIIVDPTFLVVSAADVTTYDMLEDTPV